LHRLYPDGCRFELGRALDILAVFRNFHHPSPLGAYRALESAAAKARQAPSQAA